MKSHWPDPSTRILSAALQPVGPAGPVLPGAAAADPVVLPEHCELIGVLRERTGVDGRPYAVHFHLRLPSQWNGRFFFQGATATGGSIGDAVGTTTIDDPPALVLGFAVVSEDDGHDNRADADAARSGALAFGFDPQARRDYAHASLPEVAAAAKAAIAAYYGRGAPTYSYFAGCDKGGQEGLALAQRYPEVFDGVMAGAPAISMPKAALAQVWRQQSVASLVRPGDPRMVPPGGFAAAFSDADLGLVRDAVVAACDADDGLRDGIVSDFAHCTDGKVLPALEGRRCSGAKQPDCLTKDQLQTLARLHAGPPIGVEPPFYASWPWDTGIASAGWRAWQLGSAQAKTAPLAIVTTAPALAALYLTPPAPLSSDLQATTDYILRFDRAREARRIDATDALFKQSSWDELAARPASLDAFAAHGGRLLVYHGVSDPVYSLNDTLSWYEDLRRQHPDAGRYARVFAVPGMGHCNGGPATDSFGAFEALVHWVEERRAPERIVAVAREAAPWPGRSRPLCPYPQTARYRGRGSVERASSFVCR